MKAFDLPLSQLADLSDPYLAELSGRPRDAEPLRRHWLRRAQQDGDSVREALARARLGVNLVAQGVHRFAQSELIAAEGGLQGWAQTVPAEEANWQLAVVACARALCEAQLSVRTEPARERAAQALRACETALQPLGPDTDVRFGPSHHLLPWALATASAWLTLLDEVSPASWGEVLAAVEPVLRAGLIGADPDAAEWLLRFATRVGGLGPTPPALSTLLIDQLVALASSASFQLPWAPPPQASEALGAEGPRSRLAALDRARGLPDPAGGLGDPLGDLPGRTRSPATAPAPLAPIETWMRLSRLARTPQDRQRLAGAWMTAAQRLDPPRSPRSMQAHGPEARAGAARLRVGAARLWARDGLWAAVIDALILAHGQPVQAGSALQADWLAVIHQLATAADARTARDRARRRTIGLRRWLERSLPEPDDEVDEIRWLADLASLQGRDGEALSLRREAVNRAARDRGEESLDTLLALQALRDTLAERDPGHPELEDLHDTGVQLAQRLCGPMSPEHWWWRGMRALWWHRQGHPQALLDAGEEAEQALMHTLRSADADTCACLRALMDMARALALPARSEATASGLRTRVQ